MSETTFGIPKKYKLFKSQNDSLQNGGSRSIKIPVIPIVTNFRPLQQSIQVASPLLPTIEPTLNVYPKPLIFGPKINIYPPTSPVLPIFTSPAFPCNKNIIQKAPTNCDMINLLTNINKHSYNSLSPLSDDIPISFNYSDNDDYKYKNYTGAGILILEKDYYNKGPVIVLFKSKGLYQECGGAKDNNESPSETAKRELSEESQNLFNANELNLNSATLFSDINNQNYISRFHSEKTFGSYRVYAITVYGSIIDTQDFNKNMNILKSNINLPPEWKETDDIDRFYLEDFVRHIKYNSNNSNVRIKNVNGIYQNIRGRTVLCIRKLLNDGIISLSLEKPKYINKYINKINNFLKGTITYNLS